MHLTLASTLCLNKAAVLGHDVHICKAAASQLPARDMAQCTAAAWRQPRLLWYEQARFGPSYCSLCPS